MPSPAVKYARSAPLNLEPDPRAPDWAGWSDWVADQDRPVAVDLFSGGGGLSLGLEDAGFRVGFAVDHDKWSAATHAANFRGLSAHLELSDEETEKRVIELLSAVDVSLVAGGPPCQPFSRAGRSAIRYLVENGRRAAYDERRELWRVWLRIVRAAAPRAVLLENVPDMALGDNLAVVREIVSALQHDGYETYLDIVEAPEYGVPQHRQRMILVALRGEAPTFQWPPPVEPVSIWDAIGDLPPLGDGVGAEVLRYRKRRLTPFQERARMGLPVESTGKVYDHATRPVRDDDREAFRLMSSTTRYGDLPDHLRRYRADTFNDKYKRHGKQELSRSITAHLAKDGYWYIHPVEERTYSVREAARLQTFPDWYRFAGNRSHAFRQIGNAVPPLLAERIGRAILVALGEVKSQPNGPRQVPGKPVPRHFRRAELEETRSRLDAWAALDREGAPWRHPTEPWAALVATVLAQARADDGTISLTLWAMPTPAELTAHNLDRLGITAAGRRALRRLLPAAEAWRAAGRTSRSEETATQPWWESVRLQPAEQAQFACLALGSNVLLATTPVMRLAARVTGRPVDKVDRLTDGKLAVAELVGGGESAPARMAALAAVAREVCVLDEPDCRVCPFSLICRAARA